MALPPPNPVTMPVDEYVRLKDTVNQAGLDALILPGGTADQLYDYLTCHCTQFVCYWHMPELKPRSNEDWVRIPHPRTNKWSKRISARAIAGFTEQVRLTVGNDAD